MYCIFKEKYEEERDVLNYKETKKFDYTKLRLTDHYEYEFEKGEKETDKKPDKKEQPKKPTENSVKKLSELVDKEETDLNRELFQEHFKFSKSSALLRELYCIKNKQTKKS